MPLGGDSIPIRLIDISISFQLSNAMTITVNNNNRKVIYLVQLVTKGSLFVLIILPDN